MEHVLADGTRVLIRPIRPSDKEALAVALGRLSEVTVHKRFLSPKTGFSRAELRYLTEVDGANHFALVAEEVRHPGQIVATARYVALADQPGTAEAAIVVGDHLQGLGLGSALADRLAAHAAEHGIGRFSATMLSDNRPAHRLMERLAEHLERRGGGYGAEELVADLPRAA